MALVERVLLQEHCERNAGAGGPGSAASLPPAAAVAAPVERSARRAAAANHEAAGLVERWRRSVWAPIAAKGAGIALMMLGLAAIGVLASGAAPGHAIPLGERAPSAGGPSAPQTTWIATQAGALGPAQPARAADGAGHGRGAHRIAQGAAGAGAGGAPASAGLTADGKVILNAAGVEDLTRLPGVGPKRAQAIVDLRTKLGRFKRLSDLLRVRGIGPKSLKKLEPHLVLDAPKPVEAPAAGGAGGGAGKEAPSVAPAASS